MNKRQTAVLFMTLALISAIAMVAVTLPGHTQDSPITLIRKRIEGKQGATTSAPARSDRTTQPAASDAGAVAAANPSFDSAAAENKKLKTNLDWFFGGKQQRGWHLYQPLICRLIETDKEAHTSDFARALSRWQQSIGLAPTGVLDGDTMYEMVATWQSRRIKDRTHPPSDQLTTALISDFYDPERPAELRQVEIEAYAAYKRMVAAAASDPSLGLAATPSGELAPTEKYLKIISAHRSKEYQERLRKQSPKSGRAGLAVNSPHFTGRALDIYVGGDPVETKDHNRAVQVRTPVYQWLVKNAERFGFHPYYYEPWHWEYHPR